MEKIILISALLTSQVTIAQNQIYLKPVPKADGAFQRTLSKSSLSNQAPQGEKLNNGQLVGKTVLARTGNEGGGGGDAVRNADGSMTFLDLIESGEPKFLNHIATLKQVRRIFKGFYGPEGDLIRFGYAVFKDSADPYRFEYYLLRSIGDRSRGIPNEGLKVQPKLMVFSLTDQPLEEIDDEGVIRTVDPIEKVQIAIQDAEGRVVVHRPTFEKMNAESQTALILHEALLRFVWQYNPHLLKEQGTEPIRRFNRLLIKFWTESEFIPEGEIVEALKDLGVSTLAK